MIFTRIRMWGNLSNLGQWGENPCVFFSLPYPTTFIEELLLVVEAVNCFGSGLEGLSVLNLTHTPPWLTSLWLGKMTAIHSRRDFSTLPTTVEKCSRTCNSCLLHCCSFSRRGILSHFSSSRTGFCWIYPRSSFLLRICE